MKGIKGPQDSLTRLTNHRNRIYRSSDLCYFRKHLSTTNFFLNLFRSCCLFLSKINASNRRGDRKKLKLLNKKKKKQFYFWRSREYYSDLSIKMKTSLNDGMLLRSILLKNVNRKQSDKEEWYKDNTLSSR